MHLSVRAVVIALRTICSGVALPTRFDGVNRFTSDIICSWDSPTSRSSVDGWIGATTTRRPSDPTCRSPSEPSTSLSVGASAIRRAIASAPGGGGGGGFGPAGGSGAAAVGSAHAVRRVPSSTKKGRPVASRASTHPGIAFGRASSARILRASASASTRRLTAILAASTSSRPDAAGTISRVVAASRSTVTTVCTMPAADASAADGAPPLTGDGERRPATASAASTERRRALASSIAPPPLRRILRSATARTTTESGGAFSAAASSAATAFSKPDHVPPPPSRRPNSRRTPPSATGGIFGASGCEARLAASALLLWWCHVLRRSSLSLAISSCSNAEWSAACFDMRGWYPWLAPSSALKIRPLISQITSREGKMELTSSSLLALSSMKVTRIISARHRSRRTTSCSRKRGGMRGEMWE